MRDGKSLCERSNVNRSVCNLSRDIGMKSLTQFVIRGAFASHFKARIECEARGKSWAWLN